MSAEFKCVVSGSFTRSKAAIDRAIDTFRDAGLKVLSPAKGGLFYPNNNTLWSQDAFPLKTELHISEFAARLQHLRAIQQADFLYICTDQGRVGVHVALEIGSAINIPLYVDQQIDLSFWDGINDHSEFLSQIDVKTPEEVAKLWTSFNPAAPKLYVPRRVAEHTQLLGPVRILPI